MKAVELTQVHALLLKDQIKSYICPILYLQFIDTQGSKYIVMRTVQVTNQEMKMAYIQMLQWARLQYTIASRR